MFKANKLFMKSTGDLYKQLAFYKCVILLSCFQNTIASFAVDLQYIYLRDSHTTNTPC